MTSAIETRPYGEKPDDHPLAKIFPLDEGPALWELAKDIEAHGLQEPIVMYEGMILDGRRRWLACHRAKVDPHVEEFSGGDALAFVISKNLHRRHLSESQRG